MKPSRRGVLSSITLYTALYASLTLCPVSTYAQGAAKAPEPVYTCENRLTACSTALHDAQTVIDDQDASITNLKKANKELADRLADSQSGQLLPGWAWLAIGAAVGVATYSIVRGHSVP